MEKELLEIKSSIRDIPDFPKKGILFKDITTLLKDPKHLRSTVDLLSDKFKNMGIQKVVGMESRGFIFATPVAYAINAGFVPVRKKGKLPSKTVSETYKLEYGTDTLEIHEDAIIKGEKVLIVDDLLATGGTAKATAELVKKLGGQIVGAAFVIELNFLEGRKNLKDIEVFSLLQY